MNRPECTYCTDAAVGIDEDRNFTCGNADTCMPTTAPLPAYIETPDDDEEA